MSKNDECQPDECQPIERIHQKAYDAGFEDGYREGHEDGYSKGHDDGHDQGLLDFPKAQEIHNKYD